MSKTPTPEASTSGMTEGGHYDAHSEYQRRVIEGGDRLIRSAIATLTLPPGGEAVTIADYGAGTGATSVHSMRTAIAALREMDLERPLLAIHNDVVTNDFTQLFRNVGGPEGYLRSEGGPVFAAAAAGSFFEQVVPAATVHFGSCSNASHWFREQPRVRIADGMYFSDAAGDARTTLAELAAADWQAFLAARSAELAVGGRLLVQGIGTIGDDEQVSASRLLRAMYEVASELCDEGSLDRGQLDDYVFPVYSRSAEEATAPLRAGAPLDDALVVVSQEVDEVSNPYWELYERDGDADAYAETYVEFVRAFAESTMLEHLFTPGAGEGDPGALCDEYFNRLKAATARDPDAGRYEAWVLRTVYERR